MKDLIERQAAIDALGEKPLAWTEGEYELGLQNQWQSDVDALNGLPSAQPEIVRCKDCKFYSPMNRETKTGICNLIMHQNFGDNWFCAGAERRPDESDRKRRCQMVGGMQKEGLHE